MSVMIIKLFEFIAYFAWSVLALARLRHNFVAAVIFDSNDNDSGMVDGGVCSCAVESEFVMCTLSSSCANVLLVSSWCSAVVDAVLSSGFICFCFFF